MKLTWNVDHRGGLAIVTCLLDNTTAAEKVVRLRNDLDGPVVPPRRHGTPEPGWDRSGYTCRVEGHSTIGFGYVCATSVAHERRPMTIESVTPVADGESKLSDDTEKRSGTREEHRSDDTSAVAHAIRTLGDHRPPRESIPETNTPVDVHDSQNPSAKTELDPATSEPTDESSPATTVGETSLATDASDRSPPNNTGGSGAQTTESIDPIHRRIDAVETDLDQLDRLAAADLETATSVLTDVGGIKTLAAEDERLTTEIETLRTLRDRLDTVIERHDELEVPIGTLRRIA